MDERYHNAAPPPATTPDNSAAPSNSAWPVVLLIYAIVAGIGIVITASVSQITGWISTQIMLYQGTPIPVDFWPVQTAVLAGITALFTLPLIVSRRFPRTVTVGVTWLTAAVVLVLLGITRIIPIAVSEAGMAVQAAGCLILAAILWPLWRVRGEPPVDPERGTRAAGAAWWAACAGGLMIVPWAWAGALGSLWDTLLAVLLAVAFAVLCGVLLGDRFWSRFASTSTARRILGGGGAAGVTLLLLAAGIGGGGLHLLPMVTIPALGFALAALMRRSVRTGRIVMAAVAPAAFGPLAFGDADEFLPLIMGPDFGNWLVIAALFAVIIAWLCGAVYTATAPRINRLPAVGAATLVIVVAFAAVMYGVSQPGLHGEKLLVVMTEQADLSGITGDRDQRLREVHQRLIETAETSQAELRSELDDSGLDWRPFYLLNAIEVDAEIWHRVWMEDRDDVAAVLLNPQNRPVPADEPAEIGDLTVSGQPQPNIEQVGAPQVWGDANGTGITIGIADSGVDPDHPAYADRFRGGDDSWADPVRGTREPVDPHGHGTHALGLALGADGIGVAPGADWMACSNLPRNAGNPADYLACLEFMFAPYAPDEDPFADGDPMRAAHIVTNSWGCPPVEGCDPAVFGPAMTALTVGGVFVVVAAGNSGPDCGSAATPPANYPEVFAVGAVDEAGEVTAFSSRGPVPGASAKPDAVAPGTATTDKGLISSLPGGGYGRMFGTSMAAPHVAGAVAVLWQARPELVGDVAATTELLRATASPVLEAQGASIDACDGVANTAGAGLIDVAAAAGS